MSKNISKVTLTIAIIILFVPTIIGFLYINSNSGTKTPDLPIDANFEINITNGADTEKLGESATSLVVADLNTADAVIDTSTVDRSDNLTYKMTVATIRGTSIESKNEYTCYITNDVEKCYFVKDDVICKFSPSAAAELLKLHICQSTITYTEAPGVLYLKGEESVALEPTDIIWKYVNVRGETVSNDNVNASAAQITINYPKGSVLQSRFDFGKVVDVNSDYQAPSEVYITLENEETKYDRMLIGELDAFLDGKDLKTDTKFTAVMEVVWGRDDMSLGFSGKHTYKFNFIFDAPAEFEVSFKNIYAGALTLIRAKNIEYGAQIVSTITNQAGETLDAELNFMPYEDAYIALLAFDFTAKADKYTIKLSDGNVEFEHVLTVKLRDYATKNVTLPAKLMSEHYGESKKISFDLTMEDVLANVVTQKLWNGRFTAPLKGKLQTVYNYGEYITINTENKERTYCNTYTAPADTAVLAVNTGKVVYAGETSLTGKLIVIEHGYGIKSWYWNLGAIDVKVGDTIEKGKPIGKVGSSGLCDETLNVLSFAMSANDVYFKPDIYFNNTIKYFDR